jgi:ubiquitin-protein ligase
VDEEESRRELEARRHWTAPSPTGDNHRIFVSSKLASRTAKRLLSELSDFQSSDSASGLVALGPVSDSSLFEWTAQLKGPGDTPFEGENSFLTRLRFPSTHFSPPSDRTLTITISIPETYPAQPPTMAFAGRVFHPNVHFKVRIRNLRWTIGRTLTV